MSCEEEKEGKEGGGGKDKLRNLGGYGGGVGMGKQQGGGHLGYESVSALALNSSASS